MQVELYCRIILIGLGVSYFQRSSAQFDGFPVDVCQRAVAVFANVKKYIPIAKKLPATFTVKTVKEVCSDELMLDKIAFLSSVASILDLLLLKFKTNAPIGPFLYAEVYEIIEVLVKRFIKKDFMKEAETAKQLSEIDVSLKKVQLEPSDVNISVVAYSFLAKASVPAQDKKKTFRTDCCNFLAAAVCKVLERKLLSARLQDYPIHFLL